MASPKLPPEGVPVEILSWCTDDTGSVEWFGVRNPSDNPNALIAPIGDVQVEWEYRRPHGADVWQQLPPDDPVAQRHLIPTGRRRVIVTIEPDKKP